MFKSKGFTAAFIILSCLILGLLIFFCVLAFGGKGKELVEEISPETVATVSGEAASSSEAASGTESGAAKEETSTKETQEVKTKVLRALTADDKHSYPVIKEQIATTGNLEIIKAGDAGEGITFHKKPAFDAEDTPGNVMQVAGSFPVVTKIYIEDNGNPYLMYKTSEDYYVTSNADYVHFTPDTATTVTPDPSKVAAYGYGQSSGAVITVHQEDGVTMAFSIGSFDNFGNVNTPLKNVIGQYDANGIVHFEYYNTDGKVHNGTLAFSSADGLKVATATFESPIELAGQSYSEISVHN